MAKFTTLFTHIGDRPHEPYQPGETREVDDENMVRHLVENGTLVEFDAKAESAFKKAEKGGDKNKAEGAADSNKAG